jgi:hypothetical protein
LLLLLLLLLLTMILPWQLPRLPCSSLGAIPLM